MKLIRSRCLVAALGCSLLAAFAATALAADAAPSALDELRQRLADHTLLFEHYGDAKVADWTRIQTDQTEIMVDKGSVKLAVFERTMADGSRERRIVFLGADLLSPDLRYEVAEYFPKLGFSQRSDAARQVYQQAIAWATGIVNKARQDGVRIEVDGYSRGAQFATVVAGRLGIPGITYNGMPLKLGLEFLDDQQRARAQQLLVNVYERNDFARGTVAVPGATSLGTTYVVDPATFDVKKILDIPHSPAGLRNALLGHGAMQQIELVPRRDAQELADQARRVAEAARRVSQELAAQHAGDARLLDARTLAESLDAHVKSLRQDIGTGPASGQVWTKVADRMATGPLTLAARHIVGDADLDRAVTKYLVQVRRPDSGPDRAAIQLYADVADNSLRRGALPATWSEVFGGRGADEVLRATTSLRNSGVSDDGLRMLQATQDAARRIANDRSEGPRGFDRVVGSIEQVQQIAANLGVTADGLRELSKLKLDRQRIKYWQKIGSAFGGQAEMLGLVAALAHDIDAMREHRWSLLRSEVLDTIGNTLVTGTAIPGLADSPLGKGMLARLAPHLRELGLIKYRHALASVPTFGALDAIGGVRDLILDGGHYTPESLEKLTDAAVGASWSLLGLRLSGGNPNVASLYEAAGQATAAALRARMRDTAFVRGLLTAYDRGASPFRDLAGHVIDDYSRNADSLIRAGKRPQDWITYFGGTGPGRETRALATLRGAGVEGELLRGLQGISEHYASAPLPRGPVAAPRVEPPRANPPPSASTGPGGVDQSMTIDAGRFTIIPPR